MAPTSIGAGLGPFSQPPSWNVPSQSADVIASNIPNVISSGSKTSQLSGVLPTQNNPAMSQSPLPPNSMSLNAGIPCPQNLETDNVSGAVFAGTSLGTVKSRSSSVSSQGSVGQFSSSSRTLSSSFGIPVSGHMAGHSGGFVVAAADSSMNIVSPSNKDESMDPGKFLD